MKPIRAERKKEVAHDPWDVGQQELDRSDAVHVLNDQGAIESQSTTHRRACGCGCFQAPGGCCAICATTVCTSCFGHCRCGKPVCLRHSVTVVDQSDRAIRLCETCHGAGKRQRVVRGIAHTLLAPFIKFED